MRIVHSYLHLLCCCFLRDFFCTKSNWIQIIFKQNYLTNKWNPNSYHHSESEWNWEQWQWSIVHTPTSPKLNLTIRCKLLFVGRRILLLNRGNSQCVLSLANRTVEYLWDQPVAWQFYELIESYHHKHDGQPEKRTIWSKQGRWWFYWITCFCFTNKKFLLK